MERHFDILEKQEEVLRFPSFSNKDAWNLGVFMKARAERLGLTVAISVRLSNGTIVFQSLADGTNAMNDNWMRRKCNTVCAMETSSLRAAYLYERNGETLADSGLTGEDYALCGGGFPIRVKGMETVLGAVICSNLYHIADHEFVTGSLREFLGADDTPEYPYVLQ